MTALSGAAPLIDGRYRLGETLGTGGAAVVRRARDERLDRDVAVKLFHPTGGDEDRQSGELALMASLSHPALVRMYDGGRAIDGNGAPSTYLVMELVCGPTLHRALRDGALPGSRVAAVGADLAAALGYLHARGVVHRDVKPANVLLPDGENDVVAKLGDFGVARLLDGTRVTATGMTVGTANYLSPEQARGEADGPPSDVYSLGLVLLEALTGRIAYDGVGVAAALARLNRAPDVPAGLGPTWRGLLLGMLSLDPAARPTSLEVRARLLALGADAAGAETELVPFAEPTAVLPVLPRHRGERRTVRPLAVFFTAAAGGAAVIAGVLATSMSGGASEPPAAPQPSPSQRAQAAPTTPAPTTARPSGSTSSAVQAASANVQGGPAVTVRHQDAGPPAGKGPDKNPGHGKGHDKP